MYKICIYFIILLSTQLHGSEFSIINTNGSAKLQVSENNGEYSFTSIPETKAQKAISYGYKPIKIPASTNAISFEVKGDGSDFFASIFLGKTKMLHTAHEAVFSLKSQDWQTITIPFTDFSRNDKPWSTVKNMGIKSVYLNPAKITHIGFGRLFVYHTFNHPDYAFSIRNIKFTKVKTSEAKIKSGLSETRKKIKNKKPLNILLLGDSITHMGKDQSHTYHAMKQLNTLGHTNILNAAIGGHTSRSGNIILSRSMDKMPKPDLTVIFYGANDCKAVKNESDFKSAVFEKQLIQLIQNVSNRTQGKTEFLLINGVPRVDKKSLTTTGLVEQISDAYQRIAQKHGLVLCNTIDLYNQMSLNEKKVYYKDTVHQTPEGLKFIGKQIAKTLK